MDCIFCEFISGKRKVQLNGLPFLPLKETKNTISFLSMDFPDKEDGHILVIPKKHFQFVEQIPKYIHHELTDHVISIIKAIRSTHGGCNILLNDGKYAGQTVFHSHYHVIPRDKGDNIEIEIWKKKQVTDKEFRKIHKELKNTIKKFG